MSGLFRGKHNDSEEQNGDTSNMPRDSEDSRRREPTERDRLLPPRSDGYLDPDDPAVSAELPLTGRLALY
jgi:hypothetical protein